MSHIVSLKKRKKQSYICVRFIIVVIITIIFMARKVSTEEMYYVVR